MSKEFIELIKYRHDGKSSGLNGKNASFSKEEQLEYIEKFTQDYFAVHGKGLDSHVVSDAECMQALKAVQKPVNGFRKERRIENVRASLLNKQGYKYLRLYSSKASVVGEKIFLAEGNNCPPMACASIVGLKGILSATLLFKCDKRFNTFLRGGIDTTVTGKIIEFRCGVHEIAKLQLYSDGQVCVRINKPDKYHQKNIVIGRFEFEKENKIELSFYGEGFLVSLNGGELQSFCGQYEGMPDNLFLGNGMYTHGDFIVEPRLYAVEGLVNVFEKYNGQIKEELLGGKVLPFCVGTFKDKDKTLKIEKIFDYVPEGETPFLCISTIDPCGEVWINDKLVVKTRDFMPICEDISSFLQAGKNKLEIIVEPRAPENLCTWHRCDDPYFGWFVGEISIEERGKCYIDSVKINTLKTCPVNIESIVRFNCKVEGGELLVYLDEEQVACYSLDGDICSVQAAIAKAKAWTPESPTLYNVKYQLRKDGEVVDEYVVRTGFRTLSQENGRLLLNGEDFIMKGALLMQYLPPYEEIPLNHMCPTDVQIMKQALIAKKMNANTVRMHHLGYGTNDERFARIFDAVGLTVIWTTRLIDSVAEIIWDGKWYQKEMYQRQMREVINNPSIVMWEGANEQYFYREDIDNIYRQFVQAVREVDETRWICPVSHLYYANDAYDKGCQYYQDNGKEDEFFRPVQACKEWNDSMVVRSAHTYTWLLGYGENWDRLENQDWSGQANLLESKNHAYLVTEYAVIGRQNPNVPEAKEYFNDKSYEYGDESVIGYDFSGDKWLLSQGYQAIAAKYCSKKMLSLSADGLLWCCLTGGANDGSYLKPIVDFYGYPKLAFYALQEAFQDSVCFQNDVDVLWGKGHKLKPLIVCKADNKPHSVRVEIFNDREEVVFKKEVEKVLFDRRLIALPEEEVFFAEDGYYKIKFTME